ncbi:hypothetical protein O9G_001776 [Rozella allomycis CSF55]|uniref:DUF4470 domain-containing protein n=1 Tax=Rozella allomycis (strain CSF55) TaxID=988480 RepID=A0A075AW93_ROZAC|nr:hypothetical protein O9G_001776 [Rozella allomycis CSF55]|eukprot:EPZ34520.1 hypothetical protein O9G_001776 [Rozella allomycis CSF55]
MEKTSTCVSFVRHKWANFYYPFGNTIAEDLSLYFNKPELDCLVVGCGDLRNVLFTIKEAERKKNVSKLKFVLNDWQPEIIARNVVIWYALENDTRNVNAKKLSQFWYSLQMEDDVYNYWIEKMKDCIRDIESGKVKKFFDESTKSKVLFVLKAWIQCSWNTKRLYEERKKFYEKVSIITKRGNDIAGLCDYYMLSSGLLTNDKKGSLQKECTDYLETLSFVKAGKVNPSLTLVDEEGNFSYALHYAINCYEGHSIDPKIGMKKSLLRNLQQWIDGFSSFKDKVEVQFGIDHALYFMENMIMKCQKFDLIESSNLADHVGLLSLLTNGSCLLKCEEQSIIKICSFLIYQFANSRDGYLAKVTGLPTSLFPTLLGVEVKPVNDRSDHETFIDPFQTSIYYNELSKSGRKHEVFLFRKSKKPILPISIKDSPYVFDSLLKLIKDLCSNPLRRHKNPGSACITPHLIGRLLALACADNRVSFNAKINRSIPFEENQFWNRVKEVMGKDLSFYELACYAKLYGFQSAALPDSYLCKFNVPLNLPENCPTPSFILTLNQGDVMLCSIESLDLKVNKDSIEFTCIIPKLKNKIEDLYFSVYYGLCADQMTLNLPYTACPMVKLEKRMVQELNPNCLAPLIKNNVEKLVAEIENIQETAVAFQVKVLLNEDLKKAKFSLVEDGKTLKGLKINEKILKLPLPTTVSVMSCKIHRSSGFVLLNLKKLFNFIKIQPFISVKGLPSLADNETAGMGFATMFNEEFMLVKSGIKSVNTLSPIEKALYELKENVQVLMVNNIQGHKIHAIASKSLGIFGIVIFHGLYSYPRIDTTHFDTPIIDASYSFFSVSDITLINSIVRSQGNIIQLFVEDFEIENLKSLFENFFRPMAVDQSVHRDVKKFKAQKIFKRCIIHPVYTSDISTKATTDFIKELGSLNFQ